MNFDPSTWKSQIFILMGSFWAKYILFELKMYRGVIFHETEKGYKIWRGINLSFENWHKEFVKFWPERSKVSKIFTLMGSLWAKYILFELKKYRGVILHETKRDTKIGEVSTHHFKIGIRNLIKFDPSTQKSKKKIHFNELLLSKVYIAWAKKVQRSNPSWNWRGIQKLERYRLIISKLA